MRPLPPSVKKLFFETKLTSAGDVVFTLTTCIIAKEVYNHEWYSTENSWKQKVSEFQNC